jgi:hypothetical protein
MKQKRGPEVQELVAAKPLMPQLSTPEATDYQFKHGSTHSPTPLHLSLQWWWVWR